MKKTYQNALALYRYQWKKALFSSLGVMIAAMALVISGHLMAMATHATLQQFNTMGGNSLTLIINGDNTIQFSDIEPILRSIPHVKHIYPMLSSKLHDGEQSISVIGSLPKTQDIFKYKLQSGRLLHPHDTQPYAIVSHEVLKENPYALDDQILLEEGVLEVLGIADDYTLPMMYYFQHGFIFVSLDTFETLFPEIPLNQLIIEVDHFDHLDSVATLSETQLKSEFSNLSVHPINPSQLVKMTQTTIMMVKGLIYLIVTICAVLGGIGIMNMTIANITARNTELALRISFGATLSEIQRMLMIETALLCCISAFIGSLLGVLGVKLIAHIMNWVFILEPATFINSQVFAIITGILASQYPTILIRKIPVADILKGK